MFSLIKNIPKLTRNIKYDKFHCFANFDSINIRKLGDLLESSFGQPLPDSYLATLPHRLEALYLSESYSACAIVTKGVAPAHCRRLVGHERPPYLCKFAVSKECQGQGYGDDLWNHLTKDFSSLYWRSRKKNKYINPWYLERSEGCFMDKEWIVFWYGLNNLDARKVREFAQHAAAIPPTF